MSRERGKKTNLDSDDVGHLVTRMARKKKKVYPSPVVNQTRGSNYFKTINKKTA